MLEPLNLINGFTEKYQLQNLDWFFAAQLWGSSRNLDCFSLEL